MPMAATSTPTRSPVKRGLFLATVTALAALVGALAALGGLIIEIRRSPDSTVVNYFIGTTGGNITAVDQEPEPEQDSPPTTDGAIDELQVMHEASQTAMMWVRISTNWVVVRRGSILGGWA